MGGYRLCLCLCALAVLRLRECLGQVEGNCSHYYYIQPVSAIDCNPLGTNLPLTCGVYVPRINPTTVRWYWTGSGELAGVSGTWITDSSPGYSLTAAQSGDPIVNGVYIGLFYDQYSLTILSFNSSDLGYYWCQIVINDTVMLQPSQFLNISVPAVSSTQCLNSAFLFYDFGETCADSNTLTPLLQPANVSTTSLPQVTTVVPPAVTSETFKPLPSSSDPANSRAQFTTVASSAIISSRVTVSMASETPNILPSSPAPANPTGMNHSSMCCDVAIYISIGAAILIGTLVIMCFVIVTACCICIIAREQTRKQKTRQHTPSSHELQSEGDCGLPEEVQNRRDENNTEDNQNLNYPSMYSKIQDSCKQQTPTVEEGDCVHAIVDPTTVEPPSQNDKLQ